MTSPHDAETGVAGVEIGHWTDAGARTGCTVIVLPPGVVASGEVRGGAPATREFALLAPQRLVQAIDAIVLTGGSAFGLAAADGVVEALEAEGRGYPTAHGRVPIVVAMALYDLGAGDPAVRPGPAEGRLAASNRSGHTAMGAVGAGAGATVGKWLGADRARVGGLGVATVRRGELTVTAVLAANAAGSFDDGSDADGGLLSRIAAGSFDDWPAHNDPLGAGPMTRSLLSDDAPVADPEGTAAADESGGDPAALDDLSEDPMTNTTLCAVITNARLTKLGCFWVSQGGHDGLARAFVPAHTRFDGDAVVAAATCEVLADPDDVRLLTVAAVVKAAGRAVGAVQE